MGHGGTGWGVLEGGTGGCVRGWDRGVVRGWVLEGVGKLRDWVTNKSIIGRHGRSRRIGTLGF